METNEKPTDGAGLFDFSPIAGLTYTVDEFEARYNLQVEEVKQARNVSELIAAVAVYLKRAHEYGETKAFDELFELQDGAYLEFLKYCRFDYDARRRKMFEIVNKYQLNRADRGSFHADRWR